MRHARRAIAILTGFATGFIAAAAVAYADPHNLNPGVAPAAPSTSAAGRPLWQFLALVALGILVAVAIAGLGYSLSHARRSEQSPRPQTPLRS